MMRFGTVLYVFCLERNFISTKTWKEFGGSRTNILTCRERVYVRAREIEKDRDRQTWIL